MADFPLNLRAVIGAAIVSISLILSPSLRAESAVAPTGLLCDLLAHPEETVINTSVPEFGWVYNPSGQNDAQAGYRIIVASSDASAEQGAGDMWDSGVVNSSDSLNVPYRGKKLEGDADYYWRVQTLDGTGRTSFWSAIQRFHTDTVLVDSAHVASDSESLPSSGLYYNASSNIWANRYPLRFVGASPVLVTNTAPGRWFIDFGQDAFGYVRLQLHGASSGGEVEARFGEMANGLAVNTDPPVKSQVRYANINVTLSAGEDVCSIRPPAHAVKRDIDPPKDFGEVIPFRYFELLHFPGTLTADDVTQERLLDEFDTNAASFDCSSSELNQIWKLCRNSMQILTFDGVYVDGDRERRPYESDAYIHQLSSYAVDNEFIMPRYTFECLLHDPTWPTEWKFHMIFIAWADYLQTGNTDLLYKYYDALKPDLLTSAATGDGLIRGFPEFPMKKTSDVVDWPPPDRDGFVLKSEHYLNWTNSVNNAFYYRSLQIMSRIATVVGHADDSEKYAAMAVQVYANYNTVFWNSDSQCYVDGVGTAHASAHSNFFPLAFGLVPADRQAAVIRFLHSRMAANNGMPPSVYGAQYFLEGLFQSGDVDTAIGLMTTNGPRSWMNMINMGSTITTEAWSFADKPNLDWNHAWGAAPGNLITRFILGVQPIAPGYGQILIEPHLGTALSYAEGTIPTIRGPVSVHAKNGPAGLQLEVNIPGNVAATIVLPAPGKTEANAIVDGKTVSATLLDGHLTVKDIGSGRHTISVD